MKHLILEANVFSIINRACSVTLDSFVTVSDYVVDNSVAVCLNKAVALSLLSFESARGEVKLKMELVVKKLIFSLLRAINLAKCTLLIYVFLC